MRLMKARDYGTGAILLSVKTPADGNKIEAETYSAE